LNLRAAYSGSTGFASGNERSGPLWSPIPDIHAAKELARNDSDSAQHNQNQQDNNYEAQSPPPW